MLPKKYRGAPQAIHTATWFAKLPTGFSRVGISLYKPRGFKSEHWTVQALAPGRWYNSVTPAQYLDLYAAVLAPLDPQAIADALFACGTNPVMCCYESPESIASGLKYCHRHMAAAWLEQNLGIVVSEIDHPGLPRWKAFERLSIPVPTWERPPAVNMLAGG